MTLDTNIAVYALTSGEKREPAREVLISAAFLSVQVLNEYAHLARRKLRRSWTAIGDDIDLLVASAGAVKSIDLPTHRDAFRLAQRYQLAFYDSLLIAVALANGATVFYSEDMQHGLVIDGSLTVVNPFLTAERP